MIFYPENWELVGRPVTLEDIEHSLLEAILATDCKNLSLSGGIDSSLMLYYMTRFNNPDHIKCYTMASSTDHPDYVFANGVARYFNVDCFAYIPDSPPVRLENDLPGDEIVRAFYEHLSSIGVTDIIACDGIDELTCGYYAHMKDPTEETYYKYLENLRDDQLIPLDKNSGKIKVMLPYISHSVVNYLSQVPLARKCDKTHRKKIMLELAKGNLPKQVLSRRKYGFLDAMKIKDGQPERWKEKKWDRIHREEIWAAIANAPPLTYTSGPY